VRRHALPRSIALLAVLVLVSLPGARAGVLFETGFNDTAGINSNLMFGTPYQNTLSITGMGGIEPGWGGSNWSRVGGSSNNSRAQNVLVHEGDLAVKHIGATALQRNFPATGGVVYLDLWFRVDTLTAGLADLSTYVSGTTYATTVRLNSDETLQIFSSGSAGPATAQFDFLDGAWHRLTQELDVLTDRMRLWLDEEEYVGGQVAFRGAAASLSKIEFQLTGQNDAMYIDELRMLDENPLDLGGALIPEPAGALLAGLAVLAIKRRRS